MEGTLHSSPSSPIHPSILPPLPPIHPSIHPPLLPPSHRPFGQQSSLCRSHRFPQISKMAAIGTDQPDPACGAASDHNHPEGADQDQLALSVLWWTNTVSLPVIAALGLLCNGLNLLVLTSNGEARRMPSWHLLVALALFDSLFLLCAVLELTPLSLLPALSPLFAAHTRAVLFVRMFGSTFYKASILIVVAFNVERYLCVCRPLWAHRARLIGASGAGGGARGALAGAVLGALGLALLCSVQWPLAWTVVECTQQGTVVVAMRKSPVLQAYYRALDWLCLFLFNLAPILALSFLNFQLLRTLRRIVRRDSSASATLSATVATTVEAGEEPQQPQAMGGGGMANEHVLLHQHHLEGQPRGGRPSGLNADAMLFTVVLLLFVCIGPQAPARLLYEWYGHYHTGAVMYTCISQQLVFLNASLNFCLYCLVSRRYRALLARTLRRFRCPHFLFKNTKNWRRSARRPGAKDQIQKNGQQQASSWSSTGSSNGNGERGRAVALVPMGEGLEDDDRELVEP